MLNTLIKQLWNKNSKLGLVWILGLLFSGGMVAAWYFIPSTASIPTEEFWEDLADCAADRQLECLEPLHQEVGGFFVSEGPVLTSMIAVAMGLVILCLVGAGRRFYAGWHGMTEAGAQSEADPWRGDRYALVGAAIFFGIVALVVMLGVEQNQANTFFHGLLLTVVFIPPVLDWTKRPHSLKEALTYTSPEEAVQVTPREPTKAGSHVTVPDVEGVIYDPTPGNHEIAPDKSLIVTAIPAEGYAFPPSRQWNYHAESPVKRRWWF